MTPFGGVKPLSFRDKPAEREAPESDSAGPIRKATRKVRGLRRAAGVLGSLPGEGESLHCILLGYFDLCHLLLALLDRLARPVLQLRIGTLSLSKKNVYELAALLDAGTVAALDVLTSDFQRKHDGEILAALLTELSDLGQRVAAARSHCKLITFALDDGQKWVIEGSANLRTSRNAENVCVSRDARLHAFYDRWLASMVTKHGVARHEGADAEAR